tara:strand:- start:295 stop:642 length:348 start_codon:yes stop_codon:yes gene_type:complete
MEDRAVLSKKRKKPYIALLFLALAVSADAISTYLLVSAGYATEANPLLGWMIKENWAYFFLFKFFFLALFIFLTIKVCIKKTVPVTRIRKYVHISLGAYLAIYVLGIGVQILYVL